MGIISASSLPILIIIQGTKCFLYKMVDTAPVPRQLKTPIKSTESQEIVGQVAEEEIGQLKSTTYSQLMVSEYSLHFVFHS